MQDAKSKLRLAERQAKRQRKAPTDANTEEEPESTARKRSAA
jgi:hypothetical protein